MDWINYHHLLYFWVVAKEGSIARACRSLRLTQPTISAQIRSLEGRFGERLFDRVGRRLILTEIGQVVFRYADEIFTLGHELSNVLKGKPRGRPRKFHVGVADGVPKLIARGILEPALDLSEQVQIVCVEGQPDRLLPDLLAHRLDLVLTDAPLTSPVRVKAYNHLLGTCSVSLFAKRSLAHRFRRKFPSSLDGAPFLLPDQHSTLRRSLDEWLMKQNIAPKIVGEFQDSALLKAFGEEGAGVFAAPSAVEKEMCRQRQLAVVGRIDSVIERFYAISIERKLKHPAVVAISEAARHRFFGQSD